MTEGMKNSVGAVSVDCSIARAFAQHVLHIWQLLMKMTPVPHVAGAVIEGMEQSEH